MIDDNDHAIEVGVPEELIDDVGPAVIEPPFPFIVGCNDKLPAARYHSVEAMSASGAKVILKTPAHFRLFRTQKGKTTAAKTFGSACHDGALEPGSFERRVCVAPAVDRKTKAGKLAWREFEFLNAGRIVLSVKDFDRARRVVDAVHAHPTARHFLEGGIIERSLFWRDKLFDVPCKARLDISNHGGIIDLKTTVDPSPDAFSRSIAEFNYHIQGWSNFSGSEHVLNATPGFFLFIAVESDEPYAVKVYELGRESIMFGARQWDEALARYRDALAGGTWPGYPTTVDTINLPRWKLRHNA